MDDRESAQGGAQRVDEVLASIRMPLENVEFTIEQFLLENGCRLDVQTRILLAGVRDCVARVAVSTRRLEAQQGAALPPPRRRSAA
ncbi:hypothetical protein [Paralimibaculum aggregatum]|nr:hypothetical protein [Limibaculum sp. NKW23]